MTPQNFIFALKTDCRFNQTEIPWKIADLRVAEPMLHFLKSMDQSPSPDSCNKLL